MMLFEILSHWLGLQELLVQEITSKLLDNAVEVARTTISHDNYFSSSMHTHENIPSPLPPAMLESGLHGEGHKLRINAAEFIPGVPWEIPNMVLPRTIASPCHAQRIDEPHVQY